MKPSVGILAHSGPGSEGFTRAWAWSSKTKMKTRLKAGEKSWFLFSAGARIEIQDFDDLRKLDIDIDNQTSVALTITTTTKDGDELSDNVLHGHKFRLPKKPKKVIIEA